MAALATARETYFHKNSPHLFGDDHADFVARSKVIVAQTAQRFADGMDQPRDLSSLFFETMDRLGDERRKIAQAHHYCSKKADTFGQRRDGAVLHGNAGVTVLSHQYARYGESILQRLAKIIGKMAHTDRGFTEKTLTSDHRCLGRGSRFVIEIVDGIDLPKAGWVPTVKFDELAAAAEVDTTEMTADDKHKLLYTKEFMGKAKAKDPDLYKRLRMMAGLTVLNDAYPSPQRIPLPTGGFTYESGTGNLKSLYLLMTKRLEIGGKMVNIGQHLTWLYCNYTEDPVDRMLRCSSVAMIHQDVFLVDISLQDIAQIFKAAMMWNKKTERVADLQNRVGLLRYVFAHAMPYARGSAAIGEWLEESIYKYHHFDAEHDSDVCIDLEALSAFHLAEFMEVYTKSLDLRPCNVRPLAL
jgi:hypothetical protein